MVPAIKCKDNGSYCMYEEKSLLSITAVYLQRKSLFYIVTIWSLHITTMPSRGFSLIDTFIAGILLQFFKINMH